MLKLKLQYLSHLMQRANSLEKNLMLGKIEGRRRRQQQRMRWLEGITDSIDMNLSKLRETVKDREAWRAAVHGVEKNRTWLSDSVTAPSLQCFHHAPPSASPTLCRIIKLQPPDHSPLEEWPQPFDLYPAMIPISLKVKASILSILCHHALYSPGLVADNLPLHSLPAFLFLEFARQTPISGPLHLQFPGSENVLHLLQASTQIPASQRGLFWAHVKPHGPFPTSQHSLPSLPCFISLHSLQSYGRL